MGIKSVSFDRGDSYVYSAIFYKPCPSNRQSVCIESVSNDDFIKTGCLPSDSKVDSGGSSLLISGGLIYILIRSGR